ncbi:N-acetyltransferase B complex non catalytic subunit-domain-containing protein [Bisporella sp. PMI_857]|nr:N-acetyltransferase B complex non catalytic subunit-domain-containing protein [Bisporella sp. PMI_857]
MSNLDFPIRDQQDAPIWNAIEAKNYKQAIKAIDKRVKKKSTEYLEALRIYVQSRPFSPEAERSHTLIYLEKLRDRSPPLTDIDAIGLLDEALGAVLPNSPDDWARIIGELRLQRVIAQPKDEDVNKMCLYECLMKGDLDHAEKIANILQKSLPDKHSYYFWNITIKFLYSRTAKYSEEDRTRWGRLAFAFIGKMAADAQKAKAEQKSLPVRSIHTPQEILLLHLITEAYGTTEKRLQYLSDPYLGPESTIAKGDWQLWRWKIELLRNSQQWKVLFDTARGLLARARTKDDSGIIVEERFSDWLVWEGFLRSAKELSETDIPMSEIKSIHDSVNSEIKAHLEPLSGVGKSWRRNASLAKLKFSFESAVPFLRNPNEQSSDSVLVEGSGVLSPILEYLLHYGDATTAYIDLQPSVEKLNREQHKSLLEKITISRNDIKLNHAKEVTKLVNSYKLSYLLTSSIPEQRKMIIPAYQSDQQLVCDICSTPSSLFCQQCLLKLGQSTIECYKVAITDGGVAKGLLSTDRHPADDLVVLSAMCLIKTSLGSAPSIGGPNASHILRATILLEFAWTRSKHNFQITLLLMKLYIYLGCASLAMRAYQRLGIKQIQQDTLSFSLLDRISSLHPHPFSHQPEDAAKLLEPMEQIVEQQRYYPQAFNHMKKNIWRSFQEGSYCSVIQITEAQETLSRSMASILSAIESGRILRLIAPKISLTPALVGHDVLPLDAEMYDTAISDTNSYDVFPSFEASQSPRFVSQFDFLQPEISKLRIHASLLCEKLILILSSEHGVSPAEKKELLRSFELLPKLHEEGFKGLNRPELITLQCSEAMAYTMCELLEDKQKELGEPDAFGLRIHDKLERLNEVIGGIPETPPARQSDLQSLYMGYDIGNTVLKFAKYLATNHSKHNSSRWREAALKLIKAIVEKSISIKRKIEEGGLIDWVVETLSGDNSVSREEELFNNAIGETIDDDFREIWAGEVIESWKDSIEGFSYFKLPS